MEPFSQLPSWRHTADFKQSLYTAESDTGYNVRTLQFHKHAFHARLSDNLTQRADIQGKQDYMLINIQATLTPLVND